MSPRTADTRRLVVDALDDPDVAWSIDSFGAIAEFSWTPDEVTGRQADDRGGHILTPRGALAITLTDNAEAIAFEGLSGRADAWTQAVVITVPAEEAIVDGRTKLTALGSDADALRPGDQSAALFDMGIGTSNIDVAVRTADPALIETLKRAEGTSLLSTQNSAMAAIKLASPTRVFRSAIGRIEVYQRIGSTQRDIPTPEGPHTHILPGLLSRRRTHAATIPVPEGRVPVMTLYPANPVTDEMGRRRAFDPARHARFQDLIERLGPPGYAAEKKRVIQAVAGGEDPRQYDVPNTRGLRLAMRVALRQHVHIAASDGLDVWRRELDTVEDRADPHAA